MDRGTSLNVAILRAAVAHWDDSKGDPSIWRHYMAEDVMLWSLGRGRKGVDFSANRMGHAGLMEYLRDLVTNFRMEYYKLDETVAEGDTVVGIGRTAWTALATGRKVETPVVIVTRFRAGKIVSWDEYWDTAAAMHAAGAIELPAFETSP